MWWQALAHAAACGWPRRPSMHSKLMVVDACWALVGSANPDARSLRLNFEFNLECYDVDLAARLIKILDAKRKTRARSPWRRWTPAPCPFVCGMAWRG